MKTIDIDKATSGMKLAKDVRRCDGQVLIHKGTALTEEVIAGMKDRGISSLAIDDVGTEDAPEFNELDLEKAKEISREVVERRFLNPDADHMMQALFQAILEHSAQRAFAEMQ